MQKSWIIVFCNDDEIADTAVINASSEGVVVVAGGLLETNRDGEETTRAEVQLWHDLGQ